MSFFRFLFNLFWFRAGRRLRRAGLVAGGAALLRLPHRDPGDAPASSSGHLHLLPVWQAGGEPQEHDGPGDIGTGALGLIGNILWFVLIGVLAIASATLPQPLACFVTIVGIPFGIQHLQAGPHQPGPIGQMIVMATGRISRYIR